MDLVKVKIRNLQSLLVCPIILWRVSSTENDWIFGWRSRLASQILILFSPYTFVHCRHVERLLNWRTPLIQILRIRSWWRCRWICKKTFRFNSVWVQMLGSPSLRRGDTKECLDVPSSIGGGGNDTGRPVTREFPLRTDSASWESLESFIHFISFFSSCTLPDHSKKVFWSSMSFRLAIVSRVELCKFRNSSLSVRLCSWASRHSNLCRHNCACRSRRSSSACDAWSSWWLTFSRSSSIICLCSSSRVLICAFELSRSTGFPYPSTIFSVRVFSETCCVSCETKINWLIDISLSIRLPWSNEYNRRRQTNCHTF